MPSETKEFLEKFHKDMGKMKQLTSGAVDGFMGMFAKIMGEGALSIREKELIALGTAMTAQCKPCIRLHVQKSLAAGATKEQILEAAQVAVMMAGGPAFTHLPVVIDALEELQG